MSGPPPGFDVWRTLVPKNVLGCGSSSYDGWIRVDEGLVSASREYQTEALRDAVLDGWSSTERPRFAYVAFQARTSRCTTLPARLLPAGYPTPTSDRERFEAMVVSADVVLGQLRGHARGAGRRRPPAGAFPDSLSLVPCLTTSAGRRAATGPL